jgi:OOP family OmpA-OmpF porin
MKFHLSTAFYLTLASALWMSHALAEDTQSSDETPHAITTIEQDEDASKQVKTYYKDLDQDGVPDQLDQCPNTEFGYKVNELGCELDSDGDGVYDRTDQCPNTTKGIKVNFLGCEGDADKDKVLDSQDQCPGTPLGTKVDKVGCKVNNDADGDGVIDQEDQCPNSPPGSIVNKYGCKPETLVVTNIVFNTGSYEIRADQKPILDKDISRLRALDSNEIVLITGYTDSQGSAASNIKLSWNRANSTKHYLVKNFNYPDNVILIDGQGEASPVASNATAAGRQKNRRIEFKIMDKRLIPKGAKLELPEKMKHYNRYQQ